MRQANPEIPAAKPRGGRSATVIGAGVAGLCAAVTLAEAGWRVSVLEEGPALGAGASWAAGGMLAPFCERESADEAVIRQGEAAVAWWRARHLETHEDGTLVVTPPRDAADLARFSRRTRNFQRLGAEEVGALEPDLAGRFREALLFPTEGHLDPRAALLSLARRIEALSGVVRFGVTADAAVLRRGGEVVVDATGWRARQALPELRAVRGEMLLLRAPDVRLSRPVRLLHPRIPVYVVPRPDHLFMVGATMIESADAGGPRVRSVADLLNAAYALHPAFAEAEIVEMRAGLRPAFPDNLPRALARNGVIHVNGLYRHGFLLGPWLGREALRLAEQMIEEEADADRPQRRSA